MGDARARGTAQYYRLTGAGAKRLQELMDEWRSFVRTIERLLETENRSQ